MLRLFCPDDTGPTGWALPQLAASACFVGGPLLLLPFALPAAGLARLGLRWAARQAGRPAYRALGGKADLEESGHLLKPPSAAEPSLLPRGLLTLAWLLSFLLMGCGLLEVCIAITADRLTWQSVLPPAARAAGIALCQALYAAGRPAAPSGGALATTLACWGLSAAVGAWRLQFLQDQGVLPPASLAAAVAVGYVVLCLALALTDLLLLCSRWGPCRAGQRLAAEDEEEDADSVDVAPGPAVASDPDDPRLVCVHDHVSFVAQVTYGWLTGLLRAGWQRPLEMPQLGKLPLHDSAAINFRRVMRRWTRLQRERPEVTSLQRPLWGEYLLPMLVAYVCKQSAELLGFVGPVALKGIVQFMAERQRPDYQPPAQPGLGDVLANGWVLALLIFLAPLLQSLLLQTFSFLTFRVSSNAQSALLAMVYRRALALNTETLPADVTAGSIVNHMAVDAFAVGLLFQSVLNVFTIPIQVGLTLYLLYWNIGWAGPASVVVILALVPVMGCLGGLSARLQRELLAHNDRRLQLVNELLQGIRVIKFYAWEATFVERIAAVRRAQLATLLGRKLCGAGIVCIALSTPALITVTGFGLFTLWSPEPLTAGTAFSALSLFNVLLAPTITLPFTITTLVNAAVSGRRIVRFLKLPAADRRFLSRDTDAGCATAVVVDGKFQWAAPAPPAPTNESETKCLDDVEEGAASPTPFTFQATVPRGTLTMVIGPVGSGKSTLVKALLGDVPCLAGRVEMHGLLAYVAQQAAIFHASVRDNILFGQPMEAQRYAEVLEASGLQQDLAILPQGDRTEIGEKGVTLSGGQKQRVSVARALYSQADVVVLDDPLSALDAHVGEHVFHKAVLGLLLGRGKTVVMTTHQWQFLKFAHQVLLVKNHAIAARGTMEELTAAGLDLQLETYKPEDAGEGEGAEAEAEVEEDLPQPGSFLKGSSLRERSVSAASRHSRHSATGPSKELAVAEERETGAVGWGVYRQYFGACGAGWIALMVLIQVLARLVNVGSSLLLSDWAEQASKPVPDHPVTWYLGVFVGITLASTLVSGAGNVCVSVAVVRAAGVLHARMLDCIARCPMAFFDTTPLGRILNRFSTDTNNVDMPLPDSLNQSFQMLLNLASYLLTLVVVAPVLAGFLLPVSVFYWFLQHFFRCTSRELQRLNNLSKSPIFAHLSETLGGLTTIRAYGGTARFMADSLAHVDRNATAFMLQNCANRWVAVRLDCLGALVVSTTALACLGSGGSVTPALAGLALTYAWSFVQYTSFTIKSCSEAEMQLNSVERMAHYIGLPGEMASLDPPTEPIVPADWPAHGVISVEHLNASYRPGLPLVLRDVSLHIGSGHRVGVCGRTGSGKSSLVLALFRMLRTEGGRITVDGVDISRVPLSTLRSRMAVIPQEPVLFAGTVRQNLDPVGLYPDARVWEALEVAQLKGVVRTLGDEVGEGGDNFSVGQRQLFCLGRAFLKRARILCLDEATASVDQDTDRLIQKLIRTAFTGCTVLTIAHRISTIVDYDKVLVLGEGRVLEYDSPAALLQVDSVFKSLLEAAATSPAAPTP